MEKASRYLILLVALVALAGAWTYVPGRSRTVDSAELAHFFGGRQIVNITFAIPANHSCRVFKTCPGLYSCELDARTGLCFNCVANGQYPKCEKHPEINPPPYCLETWKYPIKYCGKTNVGDPIMGDCAGRCIAPFSDCGVKIPNLTAGNDNCP